MVKDQRRPIKKMRRKDFYPEQPGELVEIDRYRLFLCRQPQALSAEPHRGIGKLPPLRYYLDNFVAPQKSDMLWTLTYPIDIRGKIVYSFETRLFRNW